MTPNEINIHIEAFSKNNKENLKNLIISAFYCAYFTAKANKKLTGKDLKDVLESIDNTSKKGKTDIDIFNAFKSMCGE